MEGGYLNNQNPYELKNSQNLKERIEILKDVVYTAPVL